MSSASNNDGWKKSVCGICPAGCWVEVKVEEGRLKEIRPDAGHPLGMLCRRGAHAPEIVHSRHRLRHPMRRVGPKGTHEFEPITWDEAYETIVERLHGIKAESGAEAVGLYTGRGAFEHALCAAFHPEGPVSSVSGLLFPFGSPNAMGVGALCYAAYGMIAPHVTFGRMLHEMYADIEGAELIVVWGANPATDSPPLDMRRLEAAVARGAEVVVIDPRRTETVQRTGAQWVPIRPGSDGALALSMLEVLFDEELYDEAFARDWCHGFDELRQYTQHFSPEVVEQITNVPAETIRDLARRIRAAAGAAPMMYTGLEYSNSGVQAIRAAFALFALAGHLDMPGGLCLSMAGARYPSNKPTNLPNPGQERTLGGRRFPLYEDLRSEAHALGMLDPVLNGGQPTLRGLILHGASLLTSWPQPELWRKALGALDFLVCIDRQLTADAAYADIVLPASTGFEIHTYQVYGSIFRERQPAVPPVGESRNDYLIMSELARRLGYGEIWPATEEALVRQALEGAPHTLEEVRQAGGWVRVPPPLMEYRKWEKGGLRADGEPGFETPTGKLELLSTILEDYGYEPLPKYIEPVEGPVAAPARAAEFPLVFNSGARLQTDFRSQHHGIDGLVADNPEPLVEISATDAEARGIATGDLVEVSTARGAVPFRALVHDDIVAGAVECNMGGGTPVGPRAWREWNANDLTDITNHDEISGFPVYKALLCQVRRLQEGTEATRQSAGKRSAEGGAHRSAHAEQAGPAERLVYLDNSATTPVDPEVLAALMPYLEESFGNPSSIHRAGSQARKALEAARRQVAGLIGARPRRVIFCGSGTEADNLAIKGIALRHQPGEAHVITSAIEHPAILGACAHLESKGYEVTCLPVDASGLVDPAALAGAIRDNTVLASVMMANNEVGSLQPVAELAAICRQRGVLFHTDAVQAVGKVPVDVDALGVDLLSLSGHKIGAPKGVGALYVARGVELEPLLHGGKQEGKLRAGTENMVGIVGLGAAAGLCGRSLAAADTTRARRDALEAVVKRMVPGARLNGPREQRLPNIVNLTLPDIRGESLVVALDHHGVALSSGSACRSGSPDPSHVLTAMGKSDDDAHCAIRLSLSWRTSDEDVEYASTALEQVLEQMGSVLRYLFCK